VENALLEALDRGTFVVTVDVVSPESGQDLATALAPALTLARAVASDPRIAALNVTDRARSDRDRDPVEVAARLAATSGKVPLVHLSGKDRRPGDLERAVERLAERGLPNVLCVTGDRLKAPPPERRVPYVDSVDAIRLVKRRWPQALVAAAVCPYKYTEEETLNQYFKMAKKEAVGADYLVTQIGWDMRKLAELGRYRAERGFRRPVVANLMLLAPGVARSLHKGTVPGVVVTDDLLALVEADAHAPDKGLAARVDRLALQIVGAQRLGYAGVQLSTPARYEDVRQVLDRAAEWRVALPTTDAWREAWREHLRLPDGRMAELASEPRFFLGRRERTGRAREASPAERRRYWVGRAATRAVFDHRSPLYWVLRPLARRVRRGSAAEAGLVRLERRIKGPLFGCRTCGFCRLPATFYVCPETCPKGLANGPCGGSANNRCEVGHQECVHSVRYRIAKAAGQLDRLERALIPPVREPAGRSSWVNHFAGRSPEAAEIRPGSGSPGA
jgi:methylenetetrahydrofolate reductase (NADPH)